MSPRAEHRELYLDPRCYDVAFDVRETARECDFLLWCGERHGAGLTAGRKGVSAALELAAGPGYHALELARRGKRSLALDIEPAMVEYLRTKAASRPETSGLRVLQADMRSFQMEDGATVDLAYNLFGSFCYLLTNDDVRAHFAAVRRALVSGGVYVVELPHPRRFLRSDVTTQDSWTNERDGVRVNVRWDTGHAIPDPCTQIMEVRSEFEVEEGGRRRRFRTHGHQRVFFAQELASLAYPHFVIAAWFGAMDRRVAFDYSRKAWRMVCVMVARTD